MGTYLFRHLLYHNSGREKLAVTAKHRIQTHLVSCGFPVGRINNGTGIP
jgi:hypothetical protein